MDKNLLAIGVIVGVVILAGVFLGTTIFQKEDSSLGGRFNLDISRSAAATTTLSYLATSDTASTTAVYDINKIPATDLNLMFTASTTGTSKLIHSYAFSTGNGCDATPAGCDWFFEDGKEANSTSLSTHAPRRVIHSWTPVADNASCGDACFTKSVGIPDVRAKWMRIYFGVRDANGALWHEIVREDTIVR